MKKLFLMCALMLGLSTQAAEAHCEIPCGIFGDAARFAEMMEHTTTIEKSMVEIVKSSEAEKPDFHTISRWTSNKEEHAKKIQHLVAQYFLAQRVKIPADDAAAEQTADYQKHTVMLHHIMVKAMKTKQTTDTKAVKALRDSIEAYKAHYFKDHDHEH